jgi:hypothetical protein
MGISVLMCEELVITKLTGIKPMKAHCYSIGACISLNAYERDQNWIVHCAEWFSINQILN